MTAVLLAPALAVTAIWLLVFAVSRPRMITYAVFALAPTQFIFIPVSNFFLSPVDVIVIAAGAAFVTRLVGGHPRTFRALLEHRWLIMMLVSYLVGFALLGVFSRTLVRVALALVPSLLACEVLRERRHFLRAATALVVAGAVDAGYGLWFYAHGHPIYPGRFSGMSGVNFSATVILTAAAIGLAQLGTARRWFTITKPGTLMALGLATLSQAGVLAFSTAWILVLRRVLHRRTVLRLSAIAAVAAVVALATPSLRNRIVNRNDKTIEIDGIARNSADVRLMVLRAAWNGFSDSPVVGIGYYQFFAYSTRDPEIAASTGGEGYGTHNTYVEILVEGGLLAFLCFVLHFTRYARGMCAVMRDIVRRRDSSMAATLVGLPIVLVSAALGNLLVHYHFWAVCGLALAYVRARREEAKHLFAASLVPAPSRVR
jgi:O-antigen ligase